MSLGKINSNFYEWKKSNTQNIAEKPGVYGLFENMKEEGLIYIGSSSDLRERFMHYWQTSFSDDPCKRSTKHYKREFTDSYEQRERELLEQYKSEHNGNLPKCNEKMP